MSKLYWVMITLLGTVHLQALLWNLPIKIPFYFTCLFIAFIDYYLYKKIPLRISLLGMKWNFGLFFIQALLVIIYAVIESSWLFLVPLFIFISVECIRLVWSRQVWDYSNQLKEFEKQNLHFNETFQIVRSERHDFLKHISAIHYLLEAGKNDEAKDYLDHLVDGYEETNLSIKGERGVVAGMLHKMYQRAKASGISIVYDFDLPFSKLPFSDPHMVALIGNLLENSIDACEEWQEKQKKQAVITLQFYKRSGLYLIICKNNSLPIPATILDELYKSYGKTTKAGKHEGLGTKIIHDIVKDNQGFLDFIYKDQEFMVKIKIPAIDNGVK